MGDARQQLLSALLVPAGALHRFFQPGGHLVKRAAHRHKLVLPGIGDSEVQIALPKPAGPFAQQVKRFFDLADHKPGEKAVGHQDGEKHHKNHPDGRHRKRDSQPAVQTALAGPEEIQGPGAALVFSAGPVNTALPGRDEHLGLTDAVRGLGQPAVARLLLTRGVCRDAVTHHDDAERPGLRHGFQPLYPAGPCVRVVGQTALNLPGDAPSEPGKVLPILQVHAPSAVEDKPEQPQAYQSDQSRNGRGDCNHQNIGAEQAFFDGHSHRLLLASGIITHFSLLFLNCK